MIEKEVAEDKKQWVALTKEIWTQGYQRSCSNIHLNTNLPQNCVYLQCHKEK